MSWIMQVRNPSALKYLDDEVGTDNADNLPEAVEGFVVCSGAVRVGLNDPPVVLATWVAWLM